jgi:hypothetical protein
MGELILDARRSRGQRFENTADADRQQAGLQVIETDQN